MRGGREAGEARPASAEQSPRRQARLLRQCLSTAAAARTLLRRKGSIHALSDSMVLRTVDDAELMR